MRMYESNKAPKLVCSQMQDKGVNQKAAPIAFQIKKLVWFASFGRVSGVK